MSIEIESLPPESGQLSVNIQLSATVNVTAFSARQKVTGFVADEISTQMHAGDPVLIMGKRICWRVPVILSLPPTGDRGEVGSIDVDVETGQLLITPTLIQEIEDRVNDPAFKKVPQLIPKDEFELA
ncbi:MAG: hypothetical protein GY796_21010 [Chloroflexi bacterium]|nr:hypothetical protein [Chloroflexota bacterium]